MNCKLHKIFSLIIQRTISSESSCCCIPSETHENFIEMMNFSLFKDPIFILFTLSNFATSLGFNVPYVYLADQAKVLNLSTDEGSYLISIIGAANLCKKFRRFFLSFRHFLFRELTSIFRLSISFQSEFNIIDYILEYFHFEKKLFRWSNYFRLLIRQIMGEQTLCV